MRPLVRMTGIALLLASCTPKISTHASPAGNKTLAANELSSDELIRLQHNVKLHLAKAHRLQALCYPADSRDRKALLIATLEALDTAVSRLEGDDELAGRMRVLQMTCHRELGQHSRRQPQVDANRKHMPAPDPAALSRRVGARLRLVGRNVWADSSGRRRLCRAAAARWLHEICVGAAYRADPTLA